MPLQGFWNSVVFFRVRAKKKLSEAASNVLSNNFSRNIFSRFSSQDKENLHSAVSGNVGSVCLDTPRTPGCNTSESLGVSNGNENVNRALHIPNGHIDDNASEDSSNKKNDKRISWSDKTAEGVLSVSAPDIPLQAVSDDDSKNDALDTGSDDDRDDNGESICLDSGWVGVFTSLEKQS